MDNPSELQQSHSDASAPELLAPPERRRGSTKWILLLLSVAVTVAVIVWLAHKNEGFSAAQFLHLLQSANPFLLLAAAGAGFTAFVLRSLRWAALVAPYAGKIRFLDLLGNTFIGFAAVLVLGRPAELLRPYLIGRQIGASLSSQVGAWFLERIYDLLIVLAIAAWALSTMRLDSVNPESALAIALRTGGVIVLVAAVGATALLIVFTFASEFASNRLRDALAVLPEARQEAANRLLSAFLSAVAVSRQPRCFLRIVAFSVLHWLAVGLSSWFVFLGFPESAHVGLAETFRFLALLALASAVPLPGLAGGFLLIAALLLTEWMRLPLEVASAIALAIWTVQLGITLPLGAVAALRSGLNWRKIKNMEREAHL